MCGEGRSQHGADSRPSILPTLALQLLPKSRRLGTRLGWGPWGALGLARHLHTPREALGRDFQWTLHFYVTQLGASEESSLAALAVIIGWKEWALSDQPGSPRAGSVVLGNLRTLSEPQTPQGGGRHKPAASSKALMRSYSSPGKYLTQAGPPVKWGFEGSSGLSLQLKVWSCVRALTAVRASLGGPLPPLCR